MQGLARVANLSGLPEPRIPFVARRVNPVASLRTVCAVVAFVVPVLCLSLAGCAKQSAKGPAGGFEGAQDVAVKKEAPVEEQPPVQGQPPDAGKQPAKAPLPRKIIYTASVRLIVEDFGKSERELERLIEANQGYLAHSVLQGAPPAPRSGEWKARIPVEKFKAFQSAVVKLGELQSSSVDSEDVTAKVYDLTERIKDRKARMEGLRQMYDIWSKKAATVKDILPIDKEIAQVREEIDVAQGQLQLLSRLSELATVTVYLIERRGYVPPESPDFGARVGRTFSNSLEALVDFGQWLVLVAVALAPWLPLIALALLALWIARRRLRAAHAARTQPAVVELVEPTSPEREPEEGEPRL